MKTIKFDPEIYKLVPIEKTHEMHVAAFAAERTLQHVYDALLAAVPDDLPGVTVYSEDDYCHPECSPTYWAMEQLSIIQATIEAAAKECIKVAGGSTGVFDNASHSWGCGDCTKAIRALSPEEILASMK